MSGEKALLTVDVSVHPKGVEDNALCMALSLTLQQMSSWNSLPCTGTMIYWNGFGNLISSERDFFVL